MTRKLTLTDVSNRYHLLAAQAKAGLVTREEWQAEQRRLLDLKHRVQRDTERAAELTTTAEHEKQDRSVLLSGAGQTKDAERTYKGIRV